MAVLERYLQPFSAEHNTTDSITSATAWPSTNQVNWGWCAQATTAAGESCAAHTPLVVGNVDLITAYFLLLILLQSTVPQDPFSVNSHYGQEVCHSSRRLSNLQWNYSLEAQDCNE